jgi:hypothetical protein
LSLREKALRYEEFTKAVGNMWAKYLMDDLNATSPFPIKPSAPPTMWQRVVRAATDWHSRIRLAYLALKGVDLREDWD